MMRLLGRITAGMMASVSALAAPVVLIDGSFDGVANDTNATFSIISNSPAAGSGATWDQVSGTVNRGTASSSTAGAVSASTFDVAGLGADPLVVEVTVASATGSLTANGLFVGIQEADGGVDAGDELWNNGGPSFGMVIDGSSRLGNRTVAPGGFGSGSFQQGPGWGVATQASINDGFTVRLLVATNRWGILASGLEDSGAVVIEGASGRWSDVPISFADFSNAMRVAFTTQGGGGGSLVIERVRVYLDGDTDLDGLPDTYEDLVGLDKNNQADAGWDADAVGGADGLTNLEEYQLGTDPQDADSDGDGLSDGDEVFGLMNPWVGDTLAGTPGDPTNPLDADSDGDTVSDGDEIAAGTNPNRRPANTGPLSPFVDSDGDRYRDDAEIAFGSDPSDPDSCPDHTPPAAKPNVVIIYADDMGLGDVSAYGTYFGTPSPAVTPHMDGLADEGVLFSQAHSANGVCTPSRYSLLTGIYNWRAFDGISGHYGDANIPRAGDVTIAEFLKTQGYDTAAFGKWHLGGSWYGTNSNTRITGNPSNEAAVDWARRVDHHAVDHGFDTFRGLATTINFGPYVFLEDDRNQFWDTSLNGGAGGFRDATNADTFQWFSTAMLNSSVVGAKDSRASLGDPSYRQVDAGPIMISQVESYIADRFNASDPDPFFAYVALYSPHKPWAITPSFETSDSDMGFHYADFMREVDDRVGRVLAALDTYGYASNTVVVVTSDNGPENTAMSQSLAFSKDPNGPLRGNKRDVWDGGTRVPFIVRWPGQAAEGMVVDDLVWQGDVFATIAAYLGVELPDTVAPDGESFLNLIRGQRKPYPQRPGIIVSSIRGDLGLKTVDGWKLIDATGGGNGTSWDGANAPIPGAAGTNRGVPKQLFHQAVDLGEDFNLIAGETSDAAIRAALQDETGRDLLAVLDRLRTNTTAAVYSRIPDNDGDALPNAVEAAEGLDPDSPKDGDADGDEDGASNGEEYVAGTDKADPLDVFRIVDTTVAAASYTVRWDSVATRRYEVAWSTDYKKWQVHSAHAGTGGVLSQVLTVSVLDAADGVIGNLNRVVVRIRVVQ